MLARRRLFLFSSLPTTPPNSSIRVCHRAYLTVVSVSGPSCGPAPPLPRNIFWCASLPWLCTNRARSFSTGRSTSSPYHYYFTTVMRQRSATAAPAQGAARAHSHSHGDGHGHSHQTIEKNIKGDALRQCQIATAAGAATNVFFSVSKLWAGSAGGSVALVADGFHALTDLLADAISYLSISLAAVLFPRCRFPYGIGRLETSGAVIVAAILLFGGIALLVQSGQHCYTGFLACLAPPPVAAAHEHDHEHHHHDHDAHGHSHFELTAVDEQTGQSMVLWTMVILAASSVVVKELLFQWTKRVGVRAGSRVIIANAYHHRADAWSGGVALLGVLGQCVGITGLDGMAGMVVSLSICQIGYGLLRDSILEFFDCQNSAEVSTVRQRLQTFRPRVEGQRMTAINVFLTRHGSSYALHLALVADESVSAAQLQDATEQFTRLAQAVQPHVQDTYTTLFATSRSTITRAAYDALLARQAAEADAPQSTEEAEDDDSQVYLPFKLPPRCHSETDTVNVALEKCLFALSQFHHFQFPISYNWERQQMIFGTSRAPSSECQRDMEAVARCFQCTAVWAGPSDSDHGHAHDCGGHHGHSH
ncbi:cation transporter [Strigomonas culicis]|uniref:Cation transporter n=1 Tax=Strigomonas culicis TaxID=28005 RepID=S9UJE1_9TRYP|nr:cation transporter [Strigomonas culicis]|eukprot:EPY28884.1 cation transporter [Strigomonas culicis]